MCLKKTGTNRTILNYKENLKEYQTTLLKMKKHDNYKK